MEDSLLQNDDKFLATGLEIPSRAESFVLQNLFADPAFARFYAENRQRISMPVYWWWQQPSRSGYSCCQPRSPNHGYIIYLPHIPAKRSDAFGVAHELGHILLGLEGYPHVTGNGFSAPTATLLSSMFTDLVINRRLMEAYGFEIPFDGEEHLRKSIRNTKGKPLPTHPLLYAELLFEHLAHFMGYEVVKGDGARPPAYAWSARRFPSLIREFEELRVVLREVGWETPQQQEQLLQFLIERYHLALFGLRVITGKPVQKRRPVRSKKKSERSPTA